MADVRSTEDLLADLIEAGMSEEEAREAVDMYKNGLSNEDLGLCPHGVAADEGCEESGCYGGPEGDDF